MKKSTVIEFTGREQFTDALTELLRMGAGQLIYQAVEAELGEFLVEYADRVMPDGRAAGVIVKCGVCAFESGSDLIEFCHLDSVFESDSGYHLRQVIESA